MTKLNKKKYFGLTAIIVGILCIGVGAYAIILFLSPQMPSVSFINKSSIDLNIKDDTNDTRNRIQIEKIGVEVPIFTGDESVLNNGAWHRKPENGNPVSGGNFVLAAHRFEIGITPGQTKQKSPFYNIDKLNIGDTMKVYYQNNWYTYQITKKYEVKPNALYIEDKSVEPKLTLYSCTLKGANDGRSVIEAQLI